MKSPARRSPAPGQGWGAWCRGAAKHIDVNTRILRIRTLSTRFAVSGRTSTMRPYPNLRSLNYTPGKSRNGARVRRNTRIDHSGTPPKCPPPPRAARRCSSAAAGSRASARPAAAPLAAAPHRSRRRRARSRAGAAAAAAPASGHGRRMSASHVARAGQGLRRRGRLAGERRGGEERGDGAGAPPPPSRRSRCRTKTSLVCTSTSPHAIGSAMQTLSKLRERVVRGQHAARWAC